MTQARIALVNMPFGALRMPSIALMQIAAVLDARLGERVDARTVFANLDFGPLLGPRFYDYVAMSGEANMAGLGDWLFKPFAFPDAPDDIDAYLARFFPKRGRDKDIPAPQADRGARSHRRGIARHCRTARSGRSRYRRTDLDVFADDPGAGDSHRDQAP